ncbi:hypothetical protein VP01_357g2 [Puccinia sorghi]|uniref:Uncharacterized protein n=1 Tax=Puccinia sorghi TaxID=27349 RepID=A0A0L6UV76_9BASI|nr:hypothetical protein VP01_357g2 [Puccinia sorghi]
MEEITLNRSRATVYSFILPRIPVFLRSYLLVLFLSICYPSAFLVQVISFPSSLFISFILSYFILIILSILSYLYYPTHNKTTLMQTNKHVLVIRRGVLLHHVFNPQLLTEHYHDQPPHHLPTKYIQSELRGHVIKKNKKIKGTWWCVLDDCHDHSGCAVRVVPCVGFQTARCFASFSIHEGPESHAFAPISVQRLTQALSQICLNISCIHCTIKRSNHVEYPYIVFGCIQNMCTSFITRSVTINQISYHHINCDILSTKSLIASLERLILLKICKPSGFLGLFPRVKKSFRSCYSIIFIAFFSFFATGTSTLKIVYPNSLAYAFGSLLQLLKEVQACRTCHPRNCDHIGTSQYSIMTVSEVEKSLPVFTETITLYQLIITLTMLEPTKKI